MASNDRLGLHDAKMTTSPRVLLTNDDGPPGPDSPYVYGLYRHLTQDLGWDVKVVIPSSQKSWVGKAYQIRDIVHGRYYYPRDLDGGGETSELPRALQQDEIGEWVLLDGTPATCTNIALHNLYPGQIDLVVSGPNLGRNSSTAFAMSSGTVGAALSGSLAMTRSIAVSYGTVKYPTLPSLFQPAHIIAAKIVQRLWANWGVDKGGLRNEEVDLYSINIPMIDALLAEEGLPIHWTTMWRNTYGQLFKAKSTDKNITSAAGSDALRDRQSFEPLASEKAAAQPDTAPPLLFKFDPDLKDLINPMRSRIPQGTDAWALDIGCISVTPLRASIAEPSDSRDCGSTEWKAKL